MRQPMCYSCKSVNMLSAKTVNRNSTETVNKADVSTVNTYETVVEVDGSLHFIIAIVNQMQDHIYRNTIYF